jgi:dihydrofolate reductase
VSELVLWLQISVDGYSAAPDGNLRWTVVHEDLGNAFGEELARAGAFGYGRRCFEVMTAFWPTADEGDAVSPFQAAYAKLWRPMPKVVFSRTLASADWNSTVVADLAAGIVAAKEAVTGGPFVVFGGPTVAAQLLALGVVDEVQLFVQPAVLGAGLRPFPDARLDVELLRTREFSGGVVAQRYRILR